MKPESLRFLLVFFSAKTVLWRHYVRPIPSTAPCHASLLLLGMARAAASISAPFPAPFFSVVRLGFFQALTMATRHSAGMAFFEPVSFPVLVGTVRVGFFLPFQVLQL